MKMNSEIQDKTNNLVALMDRASILIGEEKHTSPSTPPTEDQFVPGLGMLKDAAQLQEHIEQINQNLFTLLVAGRFKNGKSTLLNAMLHTPLLPAEVTPTTAIITILVAGKEERVAIYREGKIEPEYVTWQEFSERYILTEEEQEQTNNGEMPERFRGILYAVAYCQNKLCEQRVRLVDSPGLAEHISRTRISTEFLPNAQAIIFVLNALQPLGEDEKKFIQDQLAKPLNGQDEKSGKQRLENVFFVINRVNLLNTPKEVERIKLFFQRGLAPYFQNETGEFDQAFYNRRVFFVNAYRALTAREDEMPDGSPELEATQVPALERELEKYLSDGEERLQAIYRSRLLLLDGICKQAHMRIERARLALLSPVGILKERQIQIEEKLKKLRSRKEQIEKNIIQNGQIIFNQLDLSFDSYLDKLHDEWLQEEISDFDRISLDDLIETVIDPEKAKEVGDEINKIISNYLRIKFSKWAEDISGSTVVTKVKEQQKKNTQDVYELLVEIDRLRNQFATGEVEDRPIDLSGFDTDDINEYGDILGEQVAFFGANWGEQIIGSLGKLGAFLSNFGINGAELYAHMHKATRDVALIFSGAMDLIGLPEMGSKVLAKEEAKFRDRLREQLGERVHSIIKDDYASQLILPAGITDLYITARKINFETDPLSVYLKEKFHREYRKKLIDYINNYDNNPDEIDGVVELTKELADRLNEIINSGEVILTRQKLGDIRLRDETQRLLESKDLMPIEITRLNRSLLNEIYKDGLTEKLRDTLYHNLMVEFHRWKNHVIGPIQSYIDELSADMAKMIADLDKENANANKAIARLNKIEQELDELLQVAKEEFA